MKTTRTILCISILLFITGRLYSQNTFPSSGNVGIGTATPQNKVHIIGEAGLIKLQNPLYEDTDVSFHGWIGGYDKSGDEIWWLGDGSGGSKIIGFHTYRDGYDLTLFNKGKGITVKNDGKIGVGTSSPIGQFEIKGPYDGISQFIINTTLSNAELRFSDNGVTKGYVWYSKVHDTMGFGRGSAGTSIFVDTSGQVGIGTNAPDAKLTVKGDIHTQEVIVDLQGAVAPDFVFEEDYDLKSLEETEEYIRTKKHLPEIPSASEMEENGFELKEMNLKLLLKVEELTLHLIEQNKINKAQAQELRNQKDRIAELERKLESNK